MKITYCIILAAILLLVITSCSNQNSNPISAQKSDEEMIAKAAEEQEAKLVSLAQQLAVSLNDQDIIGLLKSKFETANSREGILNFSELLSETVKGATFVQKITADSLPTKYHLQHLLTATEITDLIGSFEDGLDFYLPVAEHRKCWQSKIGQLLVLAPPLSIDDTEWQELEAYDLNGTKQILSAKEPPQQPVLVITPCEHHGDHSLASPKALSKATSPSSGVWRLTILDFLLFDDKESWPNGDAEVFVKLLDYGKWYRTDCYDINSEGSYYNCDIPLDPYWSTPQYRQDWFEIREDDGGSKDDYIEKYWNWDNHASTRLVDLYYQYWYYGTSDNADVQMRGIYY